MLVLGFDTATPAVSVALHDGERVIAEASALDARRHSELLMPMIAKILADVGASRDDLTAVAVGVGPGPYTGLRVGLVTARVLGSVLRLPVSGVCSLDIIAASATAVAVLHTGGEIHALMLKAVQQYVSLNSEPQMQQVLEFYASPQGFVVMLVVGSIMMLILFLALSCMGGVIGAAVLKRKDSI